MICIDTSSSRGRGGANIVVRYLCHNDLLAETVVDLRILALRHAGRRDRGGPDGSRAELRERQVGRRPRRRHHRRSSTRAPARPTARRPARARPTSTTRWPRPQAAFDGWRVGHAVRAQPRAVAHRRRARARRRPLHRRRVPQHRQAEGVDGLRGDPARGRPDPVLRRRGAHARRPRRGRVHVGAHVVHPARADRRGRAGLAVELPVDDGDLEDRARARRREHGRVEAGRDHAGDHGDARRARGRVPARRCAQRRVRRSRQRTRARRAPGSRARVDHRQRARGHGGRGVGRDRPEARAPRARRQRARHRVRRRRPRSRGRGHRRRRLLQRGPGLHRGDARDRGARRSTTASSTCSSREAKAKKVGGLDVADADLGPLNNPQQLERVQGFIDRLPSHAAGAVRRQARSATPATSSSRRSSRA